MVYAQDSLFFDVSGWDKAKIFVEDNNFVVYQRLDMPTRSIAYQGFMKRADSAYNYFAFTHIKRSGNCYYRQKGGKIKIGDRVFVQIPCTAFDVVESNYVRAVREYMRRTTNKDITKI